MLGGECMQVYLNSVDKVKAFVNIMSKFDDNIDLVSGRYKVDAKSILGILSLNLSKPIKIEFNGSQRKDYIIPFLREFEVK